MLKRFLMRARAVWRKEQIHAEMAEEREFLRGE